MAYAYEPNHWGWKQVAISPEMYEAVLDVVKTADGVARELAAQFTVDGDYERSFEITTTETELTTDFGTHMVATGVLANTAPYAMAIELGNRDDHKAHHVLGRTLDIMDVFGVE